jgi:hypothetical protein
MYLRTVMRKHIKYAWIPRVLITVVLMQLDLSIRIHGV